MADLEQNGRQFKPTTIKQFKGLNASIEGGLSEDIGMADEESPDIINFNVTAEGYLQKRVGATLYATLPAGTDVCRVVGIQRVHSAPFPGYLFVSTGDRLYRISLTNPADIVNILDTAAQVPNVVSVVQHGAQPAVLNYMAALLVNTGRSTAQGGMGGIQLNAAFGFWANTPLGTHMVHFKNRMWVINSSGAAGNEQTLWFSQPQDYSQFGGAGLPNNIIFGQTDGDYMTSIIPYNDQLMVFQTRKAYVLSCDGEPANWNYRLISDRVGCIGRGTVKAINGFVYFLAADGVYKTDGTTFQLISQPVEDLIRSYANIRQPSTTTNLYASYYDNKYILWLPSTPGETLNNMALVYDLNSEVWTRWVFGYNINFLGEQVVPEYAPVKLMLGSSGIGRKIYNITNNYNDEGNPITCTWVSKKMDFGNPISRKRSHYFAMSVKEHPQGPKNNYSVLQYADDNNAISYPVQTPASYSVAQLKWRGAGYGRYFQTRVSCSGTGYAAVYDMTWMNEERGVVSGSYPMKNL